MRRRRPRLQVSLFPFLAVLLCVLGSLILLLLILDQRARQSAAEEAALADRKAAREAGEVEEDRERLQARWRAIEGERDAWVSKVGELRREETARSRELERQQLHLAQLRRAVTAEEEGRTSEQTAADRAREHEKSATAQKNALATGLGQLQEQIELLEKLVRHRKETPAGPRPPVYSLVPYKGRQGALRRPIYVECVRGHAVFRPGEERIASEEIRKGDRFAGMVRERFAQPAGGEAATAPYVLLLVRPSGISAYYSVLKALRTSEIQVGYEFVEELLALDFATPAEGAPPRVSPRANPPVASGRHAAAPAGDSPWTAPPRGALLTPPNGAREGAFAAIQPSAPIEPRSEVASSAPAGSPALAATKPGKPSSAEREPANPTFIKPILADPTRPRTPPPSSEGKPSATQLKPPLQENQVAERPPEAVERERPAPAVPQTALEKATQRPPAKAGLGRAASPDWVIVIECSAAGAALKGEALIEPGRLGSRRENPLVKRIQEQIEQRQKKWPGVRPKLKYAIHPDGLRTYYLASGALQALKLTSTWEMIENRTEEGGPEREP